MYGPEGRKRGRNWMRKMAGRIEIMAVIGLSIYFLITFRALKKMQKSIDNKEVSTVYTFGSDGPDAVRIERTEKSET